MANPWLEKLALFSTNVTTLDRAAFLFVPPAPSSTAIKSDVVKSAPMSVAPSMSTASSETLFAVEIVDNLLSAISTAGKVALSALEIDGGTDIGADLTTSDLIVVDDGAGGTNRKAALSRLTTFMTGQGFSTDDPTALAIALG